VSIPEYTLVVGVDAKHLEQLALVWPTWKLHKWRLLQNPMLVFYDESVTGKEIQEAVGNHPNLQIVRWPPPGIEYEGGDDKWTDPQRYKMLAGFIHVPAIHVQTPYWLKLDTDTIAVGNPEWVNPEWFTKDPAIVSHPWGYTKPPDQMLELDRWGFEFQDVFPSRFIERGSMGLVPETGANKLKHSRIISWCSFCATNFSQWIAKMATMSCGLGKLPVPSQDGYAWYMARRMGYVIERPNMKELGWEHHGRTSKIRKRVKEVLYA